MMDHFKCYALNHYGRIVAAEDVDADNIEAAIEAGRRFVEMRPASLAVRGLEIWLGEHMVYQDITGTYVQS